MKEVGVYEAKNQLSALIEEVERSGAEIVITRHGKPVAKLSPASAPASAEERRMQAQAMLARRDKRAAPATPVDWKELVGRRY